MTNSHNKIMASNKGQGGTHAERHFNNTSPSHINTNGRKQNKTQRTPSTKCFNSRPMINSLITPNKGKSDFPNSKNYRNNCPQFGSKSPSSQALSSLNMPVSSGFCGSPPNFSYFAGSKCYDAPAPNALPKPPSHWTTCATEVTVIEKSKKFDVFSHNLKSILNVQA